MTGEATAGLRERSLKAVIWSAADTAGRQGIQFVASILLARILSPAEFGLLGMAALFLAVATAFVDTGFSSALIQKKQITEQDKASVFCFNFAAGLAMAGLMYLAAPWVAQFYRQPILIGLMRLLGLNLFVTACGGVQFALLNRRLDFKTPCKIGIVATAVSGAVAVWLAWTGHGVWSLVIQANVSTLITTVLVWVMGPWKPCGRPSLASLRSMFGFGSRLLASGLLNTVFDRIQLLLIGKVFSPADLGQYTRAYSTQQMPANLLSTIVTRVTFPVFSTIADDRKRLKAAVSNSLNSIMAITLPMMVGLAVLAESLVAVLFGAKWQPCVPYLRILALAGALWPMNVVNLSVLSAAGRSDLFLRAEVLKKLLTAAGLVISLPISVQAMVWATLLVSVLCYGVNVRYAQKVIDYSIAAQVYGLSRIAASTAVMALVAAALGSVLRAHAGLALVAGTVSGAGAYALVGHCMGVDSFEILARLAQNWAGQLRKDHAAPGLTAGA